VQLIGPNSTHRAEGGYIFLNSGHTYHHEELRFSFNGCARWLLTGLHGVRVGQRQYLFAKRWRSARLGTHEGSEVVG
jgi:hypothetical protein